MPLDTKKIGEQKTEKTTASVTALPASDAEFCNSFGAFARFGLRRSLLYDLHAHGYIRGVSLRRRGAQRGKRLWTLIRFDVISHRKWKAKNEESRYQTNPALARGRA